MYGKIFDTTFSGSMHGAGANVHAVWAYVIANTDASHHLELNPSVVGEAIGMKAEEVDVVIKRFLGPDPLSRSQLHDGRKLLKEGPYFYFVVNHGSYRNIRCEEDRRAYLAQKQRESRDRKVRAAKGKGPIAGETAYVKAVEDGEVI